MNGLKFKIHQVYYDICHIWQNGPFYAGYEIKKVYVCHGICTIKLWEQFSILAIVIRTPTKRCLVAMENKAITGEGGKYPKYT